MILSWNTFDFPLKKAAEVWGNVPEDKFKFSLIMPYIVLSLPRFVFHLPDSGKRHVGII